MPRGLSLGRISLDLARPQVRRRLVRVRAGVGMAPSMTLSMAAKACVRWCACGAEGGWRAGCVRRVRGDGGGAVRCASASWLPPVPPWRCGELQNWGGNDLPPMGDALSGQAYWSLRGLGTSLGSSTRSAEIARGAVCGVRVRMCAWWAVCVVGCVRGVGLVRGAWCVVRGVWCVVWRGGPSSDTVQSSPRREATRGERKMLRKGIITGSIITRAKRAAGAAVGGRCGECVAGVAGRRTRAGVAGGCGCLSLAL